MKVKMMLNFFLSLVNKMNKTHTHRYSVCVYVCVSAWNVNDDYNDKKRAE